MGIAALAAPGALAAIALRVRFHGNDARVHGRAPLRSQPAGVRWPARDAALDVSASLATVPSGDATFVVAVRGRPTAGGGKLGLAQLEFRLRVAVRTSREGGIVLSMRDAARVLHDGIDMFSTRGVERLHGSVLSREPIQELQIVRLGIAP